jgi:hypothetical protein
LKEHINGKVTYWKGKECKGEVVEFVGEPSILSKDSIMRLEIEMDGMLI